MVESSQNEKFGAGVPAATDESGEIAQYCPRCGQSKGDFDVFCRRCMTPLVRRFRWLLPLQILLFVAAAVVLSLSLQGKLPHEFVHAPLVFIGQLVAFYLLRLSLRQRRFLIPLALYLVLLSTAFTRTNPSSIFVSLAPIYLAIGVIVLWYKHASRATYWGSLQELWLGLLIVGWSLAAFASFDQYVLSRFEHDKLVSLIRQALVQYTPWLSLAGLVITLAVRAGLQVASRGVFVKEDYYADARRSIPEAEQTEYPLLLLPVVLLARSLSE